MTLKAFWEKLNSDAKYLWDNDKVFFIGFSLVILVLKFRTILIDILVSNSEQIFNKTKTTDTSLSQEAQKDNATADQLVKQAEDLPKQEGVVDENWNKK